MTGRCGQFSTAPWLPSCCGILQWRDERVAHTIHKVTRNAVKVRNFALVVFFSGVTSVWPTQCIDARVVAAIVVVHVVRVGLNFGTSSAMLNLLYLRCTLEDCANSSRRPRSPRCR